MSRHTPGPWTASPHGDGWHITPMLHRDGTKMYGGARIATAHGMKGDDAKLIAAAPTMALALAEFIARCERIGFDSAEDEIEGAEAVDAINDHLDDLRAALKAAGLRVRK